MDESLIQKLEEVSDEEADYLEGKVQVRKDIYTRDSTFEIDRELLLENGKLIAVRPHSRFIEFPLHRHNYIEIMYVCEGTITHNIEGKQLVMEKGDMLLLNQHVEHGIRRAEAGDIAVNFIALPEFFDIPLQMLRENNILAEFLVGTLRQKMPTSHYLLFRLGADRAIDNLMENMISSMLSNQPDEDSICQYSMGVVFLYLLNHVEHMQQSEAYSYEDVVVQSTLQYIDTWYKTASLSKIAEDFHQSLSVLSKMIKKSTGYTFQELLQRKRFRKAVMLLMESNLSVEEIAAAVGYENQSYFYRQFKSRYGMTPRQYRVAHRDMKEIRI